MFVKSTKIKGLKLCIFLEVYMRIAVRLCESGYTNYSPRMRIPHYRIQSGKSDPTNRISNTWQKMPEQVFSREGGFVCAKSTHTRTPQMIAKKTVPLRNSIRFAVSGPRRKNEKSAPPEAIRLQEGRREESGMYSC